jgi:hypothetical protein
MWFALVTFNRAGLLWARLVVLPVWLVGVVVLAVARVLVAIYDALAAPVGPTAGSNGDDVLRDVVDDRTG